MATTAVTAESIEVNTLSANLVDAGGGSGNGVVAATPADGWVVSPEAGRNLADGKLVFKAVADGTGDTIVVTAGDRPPSQRAGMGNLSLTLAASEAKYFCLDAGRFIQDDGTIIITCTDTGTTLTAIHLPRTV